MHYKDKNLQIDIRCHTVFMNDQKIELSLKEFTVLKYLTEHPGWVFSHEEIYRNVWKEEPIDCANAVMCCISPVSYTHLDVYKRQELLLWSLTSLQGPLRDEGYRRYRELFEKCLPEMAEKIPA